MLSLRDLVSIRSELYFAVAVSGPYRPATLIYFQAGRQQRQTRLARLTVKSVYVICLCNFLDSRKVHSVRLGTSFAIAERTLVLILLHQ